MSTESKLYRVILTETERKHVATVLSTQRSIAQVRRDVPLIAKIDTAREHIPATAEQLAVARGIHVSDSNVEIDDDAAISPCGDDEPGCYFVQAWLFVNPEDL